MKRRSRAWATVAAFLLILGLAGASDRAMAASSGLGERVGLQLGLIGQDAGVLVGKRA